jgi:hypothetical protein
MGACLAAVLAFVAGLLAESAWQAPPPALEAADGSGLRTVPLARTVKAWPAYAPGPARAPIAPDEWTSDAPAFQAKLTEKPLSAAPDPPPPPPTVAAQPPTGPTPVQQAASSVAPALAAAAPAKDDAKLCRNPTVPLDVAKAVAATSLRLRDEPSLRGKPLDIPPDAPQQDAPQSGIRVSGLLADALAGEPMK